VGDRIVNHTAPCMTTLCPVCGDEREVPHGARL
jgi:rRNA maturation protein Nop10